MARAKSEVVIYHNPACATSRKVLGMIREAGIEPRVVEYLKTPPSRAELLDLLRRMGMTPRQLLRRRGTPYDELGLDDPAQDGRGADRRDPGASDPDGAAGCRRTARRAPVPPARARAGGAAGALN